METEPFNEADYTDEQLVALLGMKAHYQDEHGILSGREIQRLKFEKWLLEHNVIGEFNLPDEAA